MEDQRQASQRAENGMNDAGSDRPSLHAERDIHIDKIFLNGNTEEATRPMQFDMPIAPLRFHERQQFSDHLHATMIHVMMDQEGKDHLPIFFICGMAGMGKSDQVRTYVRKYAADYGPIIWINGQSKEDINSSFKRLADRIQIRTHDDTGLARSTTDIAANIYERLCNDRTLIVFDDVDVRSSDQSHFTYIENLLPSFLYLPKRRPFVLVTSRRPGLKFRNEIIMSLEKFTVTDSINFILKELDLDKNNKTTKAANRLAALFGGHPFALNEVVTQFYKKKMAIPYAFRYQYKVVQVVNNFVDNFDRTWRRSMGNATFSELFRDYYYDAFQSKTALKYEHILSLTTAAEISIKNCVHSYKKNMASHIGSRPLIQESELEALHQKELTSFTKIVTSASLPVVQAKLKNQVLEVYAMLLDELKKSNAMLVQRSKETAVKDFEAVFQKIENTPIWSLDEFEHVLDGAIQNVMDEFSVATGCSAVDTENELKKLFQQRQLELWGIVEKFKNEKILALEEDIEKKFGEHMTKIVAMGYAHAPYTLSRLHGNEVVVALAWFRREAEILEMSQDSISKCQTKLKKTLTQLNFIKENEEKGQELAGKLGEALAGAVADFKMEATEISKNSLDTPDILMDQLVASHDTILEKVAGSWNSVYVPDTKILEKFHENLKQRLENELKGFLNRIKILKEWKETKFNKIVQGYVAEFKDWMEVREKRKNNYFEQIKLKTTLQRHAGVTRDDCQKDLESLDSQKYSYCLQHFDQLVARGTILKGLECKKLSCHLQNFDKLVGIEITNFLKRNQKKMVEAKASAQKLFWEAENTYLTNMTKEQETWKDVAGHEKAHKIWEDNAIQGLVGGIQKKKLRQKYLVAMETMLEDHFQYTQNLFQVQDDSRQQFVDHAIKTGVGHQQRLMMTFLRKNPTSNDQLWETEQKRVFKIVWTKLADRIRTNYPSYFGIIPERLVRKQFHIQLDPVQVQCKEAREAVKVAEICRQELKTRLTSVMAAKATADAAAVAKAAAKAAAAMMIGLQK